MGEGSQPQAEIPVPGRGAHITSGCENQQGLSARVKQETAKKPGALLKGQHTKYYSWTLTLSSRGKTAALSGLESFREKLCFVAFGRGLEGQQPMSLC